MSHLSVLGRTQRCAALASCAALALPLAYAAPVQTLSVPTGSSLATLGIAAPPQMTTRKKLVLLAGAAALYYLYRRHQRNAASTSKSVNGEPIYYLSRNGRVYYRDADHRAHWVTPPPQGIQVPYDEALAYRGLQGYDRSSRGETNLSRFAARNGGM